MPGPRPNPQATYSRHRPKRGGVTLPAGGTDIPAPDMPAGRRWTKAQRQLWGELWGSPQASQWDESASSLVAVYVVHVTELLAGKAAAWNASEARHIADRLGLTPTGMQALGWTIGDEPAGAPGRQGATVTQLRPVPDEEA